MLAATELDFEISQHFLDDRGQRSGFVLLGAFLLAFLFIRTSARMIRSPKFSWWPGSVETKSGLHLHHLVWGICLMMSSGFLNFALAPLSPWAEMLAAAFGIGAGLTLDEFALWVRLEDVYWSEQGRISLDAVVVATLLGGMIVLGLAPFDLSNQEGSISSLVAAVLIDVLLAALAIFKGKPLLGLIGVFLPPVSLIGAIRLGSPNSPWARRRYRAGSAKLARSQARWERLRKRRRWLGDAIGGTPSAQ
ncbi:MAG TPA: hypothetical protein VHW67_09315 [Solirubrobacteraceae bacterium]|jgi:hypothetical protein|nr:hypothetical protein [Solirubrobacteraceae bacterium]